MIFLVFAVAVGGLCALLGYRVYAMLALSALLAVGTVLAGIALHTNPWAVVAEAVGSVGAFQFIYVAVGVTHDLVQSRRLILHIQTAIGEQLGVELGAPRILPPELSELVAKLPCATVPERSRHRDFCNLNRSLHWVTPRLQKRRVVSSKKPEQLNTLH